MNAHDEKSPRAHHNRRTVLTGAAWSVPIIAAAAATPFAVASQCIPSAPLSTVDATFVRTSAGAAYFEWTNVFTPGDVIRLNVASTLTVNGGGGSIDAAANLLNPTAPSGSTYGAVPGATEALRISLNVGANFSTSRHDFSYSYAPNGTTFAPFTNASATTFTIVDIDGSYVTNGGGLGAERVSISGGTGTVTNTSYLQGNGSAGNPWVRRAGSTPNSINIDTFAGDGNVNVTVPGSTWSMTWSASAAGVTNNTANYNLWVTPIRFTATNPVAC